MKPRILLITPGLGLGGAERWITQLCRYLREFEVAGVWPISRKCHPDIVADLRDQGVPIILPGERIENDLTLAWGVPNPRKFVGPYNKPLVVVSHGIWPEAPEGYFESQAWQATHVAAVSEAAAQAFGAYAGCATIIRNGVEESRLKRTDLDVREKWGIGPDEKVVIQIGRLENEKAPERLITAGKCLPDGWITAFVGDGSQQNQCIELARKTGRSVIFSSAIPNVGDLYAAADVVCLPSKREGMPLVVLESWMAGIPVVATCLPFTDEMRRLHGDVLSTVPQEHSPVELADAIVAANSNLDMVTRAHAVAREHYTVEAMAARWDEYLLGVVNGG